MASASPVRRTSTHDINTKLRWMFFAAPCLVLIVMVAFGSLMYRSFARKNAMAEAEERMENVTLRVSAFFDRAIVLSRSIALRQKAIGVSPDAQTPTILRSLLEGTPPYEAQGVYVAFADRRYTDPDAIQWVWRERPPGQDEYIFHTGDRLTYDYHAVNDQTEWYQKASHMDDGEFFITKPFFDTDNTKVWLVSVTRPIYVRAGSDLRFIGVAGVDLKLEDLTAQLQAGMGGALSEKARDLGGYFYLFSSEGEGEGLAYALPSEIRDALGSASEVYRVAEFRAAFPEVADNDLADPGPLKRFIMPNGESRLVSRKRISTAFDDEVVLSFPEGAVYGDADQATKFSIAIGLCALAVMFGVVITVADHYVTRPIKRLTAAAAAVESGDYRPNGMDDLVVLHNEFGLLARGFRKMVKEVSAREHQLREAQADLMRSERYYRALIENAMDIISVIRPDGTTAYESPSVRRVLGYEPRELVDRKVEEFVHPDDQAPLATAVRELTGTLGGEQTTEFRFRHSDGSWRTLEAKCTNLTGDPAVLGIVVNSRDVTERKRSDNQVRQLNASLDHRVRLRTAELEQTLEELRGAKEAAERATKQMEEFATSVAHDMRNLLMIIIGYGEDLLRRAIKKKIDAFVPDLRLIANKGNEMIELLNDLLCQSKAMSGKGVVLNLDEFDVAGIIRGRMAGIELIAQKNGNTVGFYPGNDLGTMVADEVKVCRILMNLLTNACKFTQNGEITLSAEREQTDGSDWLVFRVADTGIGMSPEQVAKLFGRFAQVHDHGGWKEMGFGLGLANCLLYCGAMGGEITVKSEAGQGTTVTVRLPAVVPADGRAPVAASGAVRELSAPGTSGSANLILIIDDDTSVNELIQRSLGEEGFQTLAAHTGEEGLRLAKLTLPSAIILDVVMPGIDGWAVLAALKTDAQTSRIPVIMASMLDERERGIRMGADAYVTKPFSRDRLADILHKHLGGRPSARILLVSEPTSVRDRLRGSLGERGWEVTTAAESGEALRLVRDHQPDLILVDLPLEKSHGGGLIEGVRENPAWDLIPIIVMSSAELSPEDRRDLQDRVEKALGKGLYDREQLFHEIRGLVDEYNRKSPNLAEGNAHA